MQRHLQTLRRCACRRGGRPRDRAATGVRADRPERRRQDDARESHQRSSSRGQWRDPIRRRRLEIARALASDPRLLILDEPAAGMNPAESARLRELMRALVTEGLTIVLIEHDVRLVMGTCERVAVLNFGRKIAEGTPPEIQASPAVREAYLGSEYAA